jgi:hypothetical protein
MRICGLLLLTAALMPAEDVYLYHVADGCKILWVTPPADKIYDIRWLKAPKEFHRKGDAGAPVPTTIGANQARPGPSKLHAQSNRPTVPVAPASGGVRAGVRASAKPVSFLSQ